MANEEEGTRLVQVAPESVSALGAEGKEEEEDISALREWFELIVRAAFWAVLLYLFVFQVSMVEGPSMQPNFQTDDKLVIDKVSYRFTAVKRFDVVVFQAMDMDAPRGEREYKDYIKRVMGLPGEKIEVRAGKVYANGQELKQGFGTEEIPSYYQDEFTVPPKHYFVMGDNRSNSKDSRSIGLGFVPESQIRGLVRLRFYPFGRFRWLGRGE